MPKKQLSKIPKSLFSLASKIGPLPAGIVCPEEKITMQSIKLAHDFNLILPILIGDKKLILKEAKKLKWKINNFKIVDESDPVKASEKAAKLAKTNKIKIIIKGNLHTDILMKSYLKKEFKLIQKIRLSHIWHMTIPNMPKPIFITDGALNVLPRVEIKMHILKNVVNFANKIGIKKPKVAIISATEDPIESMPSSLEAKELMKRAIKENINAYIYGPLALDNAISLTAAKRKKINNQVAGKADVLLVPNIETGNALSKLMVYFMKACAAGFVVGGKVPVVVPSRADNADSRLASIAAAIISTK